MCVFSLVRAAWSNTVLRCLAETAFKSYFTIFFWGEWGGLFILALLLVEEAV